MFQSSDSIMGSPTFHLVVTKEGEAYKASCPAQPAVAPEVRPTETDAILAMRAKLERFVTGGCKG